MPLLPFLPPEPTSPTTTVRIDADSEWDLYNTVTLGQPRVNVVQNPRAAADALNWDWSWDTLTRLADHAAGNIITNPDGATNTAGWETDSDPTLTRVTSISGVSFPDGASTALAVGPATGGAVLQCDSIAVPQGVSTGDWIIVSADLYVDGVTNVDASLNLALEWNGGYIDIVAAGDIPETEFVHFEGRAQLVGGVTGLDVYITCNERIAGGANDAVVYATNITIDPGYALSVAIPNPQGTAFKVTSASGDTGMESNEVGGIPLPLDVGPEDWIAIQFEALAENVTDHEGFIYVEPGICDVNNGGGNYPDLLNSDWPRRPQEVTDFLPLAGWQRYTFNYQLGADEGWADGIPHHIDLILGIETFENEWPLDTTLYVTNIFVERSTGADFIVRPYEDMDDIVAATWNVRNLLRLPGRPNYFPNPRAEQNLDGWGVTTATRVTSAPEALPSPATAAVLVEASGASRLELNNLQTDWKIPFHDPIPAGTWLSLQYMWLVDGLTASTDGAAYCYLYLFDANGDYISGSPFYLINEAYWEDPYPRDPLLVVDYLPDGTWEQYSGKVQVPADATSYMFGIGGGELVSGALETPTHYVTNVLFEKTTQTGELVPYSEPDPSSEWVILRLVRAATGFAEWILGITSPGVDGAATWSQRNVVGYAPEAWWTFPAAIGRTVSTMWRTALARVAAVGNADWSIVGSNPISVVQSTGWKIANIVGVTKAPTWDIERREDDVRTVLLINGHNYNDGVRTFVGHGIKMPAKKNAFDEVRSYTGDIRQVDVHTPLLQATIPLQFRASTALELDQLIDQLEADLSLGGTLIYQEGAPDGETAGAVRTYTMGISDAPDITRDRMYIQHHVAIFEIQPYVAPW